MTDKNAEKLALERFEKLQRKRQQLLTLPPKEVMNRILEDPQPIALVHSFPEQDFYFLIHDIGPEESLPLLSLASKKQWEYIIDLEAWQKDQINIKSVSRWLDLLLEADSKRFIRWFLEDQLEFIEFYLFKNIEIRVREHDQNVSDFSSDYFSLDDKYFLRFIKLSPETEADGLLEEQRNKFLTKLAKRLAAMDHIMYQNILMEAAHVIPAETEEECYRRRNVRLAQKGFLPFDEAIGIYQPIKPQDIEKQSYQFIPRSVDRFSRLPVPQYPIRLLKKDNHFARALAAIETQEILTNIEKEFANLCNRIIVADHKTIREREELRDIVKKTCGYISIGLERLTREKIKVDPYRAAALLNKYPLSQIFKVGFGSALELKWQAEKWLSQSWFARCGLRLTFWGEQWLGVLGGLLLKKPLFYDSYKTGVLYREFASLEDIQAMRDHFNQVKAVDDLLSLMSIELGDPSSYGFLTYKNLILTLWAGHTMDLPPQKLRPLTLKEFVPFFNELLPGESDVEADQPRKIPQAMKNHFLNWLADDTGLQVIEITERLGKTFENLFEEIQSELGRIAVKDLDPRYIRLFLFSRKSDRSATETLRH